MAKEYKIEKEKLDALLAEVTGELNQILKSEQTALAKAADDDAPAEESSGSTEGAPADDLAPDASASPEASAPMAPPAPEASAPEASPAEASPEASPEASADAGAPPSLEELTAAYAQLPPEQLDLHLQAAQAAAQQLGLGGPEASAPAAPAAAPPAPEASAPAAPMPPPGPEMGMGKGEKPAAVAAPKANGGQIRKSEKDLVIEALQAQLADQGKALTQLVDALNVPFRKSVKGISEIAYEGKNPGSRKVTDLSKAEVTKLLREKARDASLSKSDRALIVAYTTGSVSVEKLEHLLASAK